MENIEFLGGVEGAERNLASTENGFCISYEIILTMFKLISALIFLTFLYHLALKYTEIFFSLCVCAHAF